MTLFSTDGRRVRRITYDEYVMSTRTSVRALRESVFSECFNADTPVGTRTDSDDCETRLANQGRQGNTKA
jgi:hypothetical protein